MGCRGLPLIIRITCLGRQGPRPSIIYGEEERGTWHSFLTPQSPCVSPPSPLASGMCLCASTILCIDLCLIHQVIPLIKRHHLLLVTLLLFNATANEALPLFLDGLLPQWAVRAATTLPDLCLCTR